MRRLLFLLLLPFAASAQKDVGIQNCWLAWTPSTSTNVVAYHILLGASPTGPYTLRGTRIALADIQPSTTFPGDVFVTCDAAGLKVSDVTGSTLDYYIIAKAENVVADLSVNSSNEATARLHVPPGNPNNARVTKTKP